MSESTHALSLLRAGRIAEAHQAFEQVLQQHPDDIDALNVLAIGALQRGELPRATELLEHAVQTHPADSMSWHHLGRVREASGDVAAAIKAHGEAVRLRPDFHVARLHLGACLDQEGQLEVAAFQYMRALQDAQLRGTWLNADTTPRSLQPRVERAVTVVRATRRAILDRLLEPLVARHGRQALVRVERSLRILMREEAAEYPDPRQRPTFYFFPGLPTAPYLDRDLFPWIADMEAHADTIRAELRQRLESAAGRERVFTSEALEQANLRGADVAPSWNGYYFYRYGERRAENCAECPATAAVLERVPLAHVRGHGPEVLYSVFTPGTHLLPHRGVTNTRLVAHLPLIVPRDCALNVGGELHAWQEGRVVVFDDTYEHEAWNRSDSVRVVMIFDIWNPHLTEVERLATTEIITTLGDLRETAAAA
jgi:aspartate beta-hydroxylase